METIRRYVFPIVWMAIFALIALALGKMAFFSGGEGIAQPGDEITPNVSFDEYAMVPAQRGDIASVLELAGTVRADEGEKIVAADAGEINKIWVEDGDRIEEGARVLQVRVAQEPEAPAPAAPELDENGQPLPAPEPEEQETKYRYYTLHAKDSGTVEDLGVTVGQQLSVGDQVGMLSPGTYSIVADLTPEQQLSLLDLEVKATAALPTAAEPIVCEGSSIDEKQGGGESPRPTGGEEGMGEIDPAAETPAAASAQLLCPVPDGTKIVPGLSVDVSVDLGSRTGVLTVPTTAVEGELADGAVYLLDPATGEPVRTEVVLGLRGDGIVEIAEGLEEGQEVLQFVPGVDNPEDGMYGEGMEVW
ncbi:efflux RND transporter periplasmic adaptor subunit [Brachybacterium hainanense]|uniref:Efflux RND transporter periplasmic adaptor subunit n=1 Tax=Brachybacterium hainanense TaxID=1541174 RepID=A0ABV6RBK6_9MICO